MCYRQDAEGSGDLSYAGGLYHRRPALALGEARRFVFVGVYAAELFAICVVNADKPMVMFAAAVPGERILVFIRCFFYHFARLSLCRICTALSQENRRRASTDGDTNTTPITPKNERRGNEKYD